MSRLTAISLSLTLLTVGVLMPRIALAQEAAEEGAERVWSGRSDLGVSFTEGNSNTESFNAHIKLERQVERSTFHLKLEGLKSDTADDRFLQVDPGFTWLPGEEPSDFTSSVVEPGIEPDVENYYLEALYERTASATPRLRPGTMNWHVGASWDRNEDAGLVGRTVLFAGVGHEWWDREDLQFRTRYAVSYTDRNERSPDPDKEDEYGGLRFDWHYHNQWGPRVTYENDLTFNMSLVDTADYNANMRQAVSVPMSQRLSLTVSLKWLYSNEPALEDIDLIAEVVLIDPDGIPGSGDEIFETVGSGGGTIVELGSLRERKKTLDTVFSTSLRITF